MQRKPNSNDFSGHGLDGATTSGGWVLDRCHSEIRTGDVVIADYRGRPQSRFEVLSDDGRGMYMVRDPDGNERPMRPSTLLSVAQRIERTEIPQWAQEPLRDREYDVQVMFRVTADNEDAARELCRRIAEVGAEHHIVPMYVP